MEGNKTRAGIAGVVAALVALGAGELLAGLFDAVPSPLASVGGLVVDWSPAFVEDFAIAVFGTADKAALAIGTSVVVLLVGRQVGIQTARRFWVGPLVFGLFGLLGMVAGWSEPFAEPVPLVVATAMASVSGWLVLRLLLESADRVEEPTDGLSGDTSRRRFIRLAVGTSAAAAVAGATGRALLTRVRDLPEVEIAAPASGAASIVGENSFAIAGLSPIIIPNDEFYRIDTALLVPSIDEVDWSLRVHGLVDSEVVLSYQDLLAMEIVEDYVTIACVSNEVGGDLIGNALWSGVRLTDVLDMAGLRPEASQLVGRSIDGFTAGFPPELAYDGRSPLIALGMNGDPLPRRHGFPARLIVPGLYGYVSATKWLTEIELTTWDGFDGYWIPRGWAKEAPIKTQSRIDVPTSRQVLDPGPNIIAGVAWAPLRGIDRVEVQVGDGEWQAADISTPLSDRAWVQWKAEVDLESGRHLVRVRATDGTGETQTAERVSPRPDGATGHHQVRLQVA
ncbi:MAG: molybdopterin-dependent oxidoreductase [Acidimicrobiia bacterium]